MKTIKVCPGIGDNIWLIQKLINAGEKFNFVLSGGQPRRGLPLFELFPDLVNSAQYGDAVRYDVIKHENITRTVTRWQDIKKDEFYLTCNRHLELGHRIENFLPDLKTSFRLPYDLSRATIPNVKPDIFKGKKAIGIYGSSYSTARAWGFWEAPGWYMLIDLIRGLNKDYVFVILGADFDTDMNEKLCGLLRIAGINHLDATGFPLVETAYLLTQLHYFFAFPSGLPIMANTLGVPTCMFYPKHLNLMMNTWADPEDIKSGFYKAAQFCTPETIFNWAVENGKI